MAGVADITEQTTSEEIAAIVDEIHAERTAEKEPKPDKPAPPAKAPKSDAEIVHADSSNVIETTAAPAKGKGGDSAAPPKKGKGETPADRSWLDDELKGEAAAHGIGEEELADFTSREEVDRAFRLFDKSALEAGRKAEAEGAAKETGRDDKGRFVAKAPETETKPDAATAASEPEKKPGNRYEVKLDKDEYDDKIVDELQNQSDFYTSQIDELNSRLQEMEIQAKEQRFDGLVDKLGHPDLFGETGKETKEEHQRRHDLLVDVEAYVRGRELLGRPVEMSEELVRRVARMVFANEIGKKELKSRTAQIQRQSNGRQGGGVTRPTDVPESGRDWAARRARELAGP